MQSRLGESASCSWRSQRITRLAIASISALVQAEAREDADESSQLSDWNVDFTLIRSLWTSMGRPRVPSELAGQNHAELR